MLQTSRARPRAPTRGRSPGLSPTSHRSTATGPCSVRASAGAKCTSMARRCAPSAKLCRASPVRAHPLPLMTPCPGTCGDKPIRSPTRRSRRHPRGRQQRGRAHQRPRCGVTLLPGVSRRRRLLWLRRRHHRRSPPPPCPLSPSRAATPMAWARNPCLVLARSPRLPRHIQNEMPPVLSMCPRSPDCSPRRPSLAALVGQGRIGGVWTQKQA